MGTRKACYYKQRWRARMRNLRSQRLRLTFPENREIRRSERGKDYKNTLSKNEENVFLSDDAMKTYENDNFRVTIFDGMGRGVITKRNYARGEFVMRYSGELLTHKEALVREKMYNEQDGTAEGYMFFFSSHGKKMCVDATREEASFGLGRLINHSVKRPNIVPRVLHNPQNDTPVICFFASKDIPQDTQLFYSYGEKRSELKKRLSWLLS